MTYRLIQNVLVCALSLCVGAAAHAQTPADEVFLTAEGYPAGSYTLQMQWVEAAGGDFVTGYLLQPHSEPGPVEIYRSSEFAPVDPVALGIAPKAWQPVAVSRDAEVSLGLPYLATANQRPQPFSAGLHDERAALVLDEPDLATAAWEDAEAEAQGPKGATRIGLRQAWPASISVRGAEASLGAWRDSGSGMALWQVDLVAPGALGQRIHIAELALPAGGQALVYASDDPSQVHVLPNHVGADYWTPTVFSESVTLELAVPAASVADVALLLHESTYQYKDVALATAGAGSCNLDVACYADWRNTSLGVGGIGTIGRAGQLWCTGSLLADGDTTTNTPFFLTAFHCVSSASEANTLEIYWLYQRDDCGGRLPRLSDVPRTAGGADFLIGTSESVGTDVTLLRLRNQPPPGLIYLGFDTAAAALSDAVACIHHPSGDFKRISFGTITNVGSPSGGGVRLQPIGRFHEILWQGSTTEPGSSGSPLFLAQTQRIIGQLWGGRASCSRQNEPDYYGRFDQSWPLLASFLAGPPSVYDLNKSGLVDSADLQLVINAALEKAPTPEADLDGSGRADSVDVQRMVQALLTGAR